MGAFEAMRSIFEPLVQQLDQEARVEPLLMFEQLVADIFSSPTYNKKSHI